MLTRSCASSLNPGPLSPLHIHHEQQQHLSQVACWDGELELDDESYEGARTGHCTLGNYGDDNNNDDEFDDDNDDDV